MDTEVYSFALKSTLNEIHNICPDIKNSFIYKEDGEIIAKNDETEEQTIVQMIDSLDLILDKAEPVGNLQMATFNFSKGRVNISHINDLYFVTVASENLDQSYIDTINNVLVPTILKLIDKITSAQSGNITETRLQSPNDDEKEQENEVVPTTRFEKTSEPTERITKKPREMAQPEENGSEVQHETTANQFIVENIGGLLVPSDTVRVDNETLLQWEKNCNDNPILQVEIETFGGKNTQCKVKPLKDSKYAGKGIVQMPEKIQSTLEIKKGELVRVKPIVT